MKVDVGCGAYPTGNVNVDLFRGDTPHAGNPITPKVIPNFVRADAHHLPFRDAAFTEANCSHIIEHEGVDPDKVLTEILRVTEGVITLVVPHRINRSGWLFRRYMQHSKHCRYFNVRTIRRWLKSRGIRARIDVRYKGLPHDYFSLIRIPLEIEIRFAWKSPTQPDRI
ncbi:MAG: class I SAM-dependent methyltransferase [Candidatus Bathyarchaeota archaeon]|nr:class I SAM-dependent methyltransferase [Candidatus Bathyarchaeota archaeon]MDH5686240.1 class I SAM-dependent methyltransferase [Candidatus Bathyarchaeota archaeon]